MKRGEPLETYVRRISSSGGASAGPHEHEQEPGQEYEEDKGLAAAVAVEARFSPTSRGGCISPRVLAAGLLAASMEA
jgi:hypothetical protein